MRCYRNASVHSEPLILRVAAARSAFGVPEGLSHFGFLPLIPKWPGAVVVQSCPMPNVQDTGVQGRTDERLGYRWSGSIGKGGSFNGEH
jgi:hypothetical protein